MAIRAPDGANNIMPEQGGHLATATPAWWPGPADLIEGCQTSIFFASLLWSSLLVIHLITNIQLPEESGLIDT